MVAAAVMVPVCMSVCQGMACDARFFPRINSCSTAKDHFPCGECIQSFGLEQPVSGTTLGWLAGDAAGRQRARELDGCLPSPLVADNTAPGWLWMTQAYVTPEAPEINSPGMCVISTKPRESTCEASHGLTRRLCPCLMLDMKKAVAVGRG